MLRLIDPFLLGARIGPVAPSNRIDSTNRHQSQKPLQKRRPYDGVSDDGALTPGGCACEALNLLTSRLSGVRARSNAAHDDNAAMILSTSYTHPAHVPPLAR